MNSSSSLKMKKIFKNFAEYWNLVKILSEEQRTILTNSLPINEQKSLKMSYSKGGWQDLFMRNLCDYYLDNIKKKFGVDLLEIKAGVASGQQYLVQKDFWLFVNGYFGELPWEDISYIFNGIVAESHEDGYVKLTRFK